MKHRSEVVYTLDDNGIWLRCIPDFDDLPHWEVNLGFGPSAEQITAAWAYHLERPLQEADSDQG